MNAETRKGMNEMMKRAVAGVAAKTASNLRDPRLISMVRSAADSIQVHDEGDDAYWAARWPKQNAWHSAVNKAERLIEAELGKLSDEDSDAIADAMDA